MRVTRQQPCTGSSVGPEKVSEEWLRLGWRRRSSSGTAGGMQGGTYERTREGFDERGQEVRVRRVTEKEEVDAWVKGGAVAVGAGQACLSRAAGF